MKHPGQRDRPRPDRHRGHPHPGRRRGQGAGQGARAQADGPARGHGRRLPVPALRRGVLGDRPDHRGRRRTDVPVGEPRVGLRRARQHREADGAAARGRRRLELSVRRGAATRSPSSSAAGARRGERRRPGRAGRRALRDGARRRPGARRARPRSSAVRPATRGRWSSHSTVAPATPAELEDAAAGTAYGRRRPGQRRRRWAPPTARWRSWSAGPTRPSPPRGRRSR